MAPNLTLTPELAQAEGNLAPISPEVQGGPAIPAAVAAAPPAGQAALGSTDDEAADAALKLRATQPAPGSFGAKVAAAAGQLGIPTKANGKPEPGGWAKSLVGGAQSVLASFGDVPTGKAPVGGGIMSGIAGTLRNRGERLAQQNEAKAKQKQQDRENTREDAADARAEQEFKLNMTTANLRMENEQRLAHQTEMAPTIAVNQKLVKSLTNPASPFQVPVAAEDVTYDQIQKGIIDGKWNHHDYTAYPTGTIFEKGQTDPTTTYTLLKFNPNQQVKMDDSTPEGKSNIDFINANHGTEKPIQAGQTFTADQLNHIWQNASDVAAATAARNKTLRDSDLAKEEDIKKMEPSILGKNPLWIKTLAWAKNDPVKAAEKIGSDPTFLSQFPHFNEDLKTDYPEFDKLTEMREAERIKQAEKAADDKANQITDLNPDVLAKINTLPAPIQKELEKYPADDINKVANVAFGTDDVYKLFNPRGQYKGGKGMTTADAAALAHLMNPQYDITRAPTYAATRQAFATKKQADTINNLNTALGHLDDLYQNTDWTSTIPGVKLVSKLVGGSGAAAETDLNQLSEEVAAAYKGGAPTKDEVENQKKALSGSTPAEQKTKLLEAVKLVNSKLSSFQKQWNDGSVPGTKPPYDILSPESSAIVDKYTRIQNGTSDLKNMHQNPATGQQIGWNGSAWVDVKTGQPLQSAPAVK